MANLTLIPPSQKHPFEFHVSRQARDRYEFDQALFSTNGNVIFANFNAARSFADQMNKRRDLVNFPEEAVQASQINAMGLVDEMLHEILAVYRRNTNPNMAAKALGWLNENLGAEPVEIALRRFAETFPPVAVYRGEIEIEAYLAGATDGIPHREVLLEEMILLWLANSNPAFAPFIELFDDEILERETAYAKIMPLIQDFFETQPTFGPQGLNLIRILRAPILASPGSLIGQLEYLRGSWGGLLDKFVIRMLTSMDFIREETKPVFGTGGPGPSQVIEFGYPTAAEPEAFSPDRDWMPSCILIAKNAFVWLDQLSKKYQRAITRLDEIPDQELDDLAEWGITGLWLIGLWERSTASKTIKQMRGNPDAVASAYSLMDYSIAADLGGDAAYAGLREKTWKRGIRLASDMVPNHMGIDSRWVVEHPDWFVSLDYPPFPSYTYNGPNLSWDGRVGLYLEDHYFNNSDAAVVFKRVDFWTGSTKYIYHGNDGTSMPWNDTAQLNYLLPDVREAVIQTILHVARRFPIIRFDAAMTLAKKHYQRLWFPEPGSGGDIASRAGLGLTKDQFDAAFPVEFWREVVDRVAQEVPDTLLLAEAFWMMEGYFVRTLGMHRVYNSAFMNMMRDEKNAEYRQAIKNTLEFDPEILKRYVNFMNNPDERTAVDQFGKGDKYFGVCIVMSTLPGLPMIGHGQIEGFTEKYGMEYRRAYWEEQVDGFLVDRHIREVFPLLRKRYIFAEVENFLLYDFYTNEGAVNEDVFAYSNRSGSERSLVIYQNRFATARGWIRTSAAFAVKTGEDKHLEQRSLAEGLGIADVENGYTIFRDSISGLEYIRNNRELIQSGLFVELDAYKTMVFLDFRQVQDNERQDYARVAVYLQGGGAISIEEAILELALQPILNPYRELVNPGMLNWLADNRQAANGDIPATLDSALAEFDKKVLLLLDAIRVKIESERSLKPEPEKEAQTQITGAAESLATIQDLSDRIHRKLAASLRLPGLASLAIVPEDPSFTRALAYLGLGRDESPSAPVDLISGEKAAWGPLLAWLSTYSLGAIALPEANASQVAALSSTWMDEWMFGKVILKCLSAMGLEDDLAWRQAALIRTLMASQGWAEQVLAPTTSKTASGAASAKAAKSTPHTLLLGWLNNTHFQRFINVNRYQDTLWFNREAFDRICWWFLVTAVVDLLAEQTAAADSQATVQKIGRLYGVIEKLVKAAAAADYRVENLLLEALRRS